MHALPPADLIVLVGYLAVVVGWGCWFARGNDSAERFMAAGRGLPGWVVGLSIFGSYVSSISFLANPGKAYAENWNPLVFALSLPLAAWAASRWFVPFFRRSGEISAYEHLERRFGAWARTYGVVCYLLTQLARLGTILYLLALALEPMLGLELATIILLSGAIVTLYPFFGGSEGVIWTGAVQAFVLVAGVVVCVALAAIGMPEGPGQIVRMAADEGKFSLGSFSAGIAAPTFWVVLVYGLAINLQNFGIDQSYVQRYITARSERAAAASVWMGAIGYLPLSAALLFIGTALWAFYRARPDALPAGLANDAVFPHFIETQLPLGLKGLVLAAICSAAMDSNLNCCATLYLCDIHRRYLRRGAGEAESLLVLRGAVLAMGLLSTAAALAMIGAKSALDVWWDLAGVFSGGMLGLFLLGLLARRANGAAAAVATSLGVAVIVWMTWSPRIAWLPGAMKYHGHSFLTIVAGTLAIIVSGMALSWFAPFRRLPAAMRPAAIATGSPSVETS